MSDHLSFRLSEDFIDQYRDRPVQWGFDAGGGNTLGELTWLTKYSRVKPDGTKEQWWEGCRRVIEGMFSILKDHCEKNRTPWNHNKAQVAAQDAYERMFTFKWTPPGRGLWMMGTEFVWEEGSAALQNCYRSDVEIITAQGTKTLGEVVGTVQTVLTEGGKWVEAPIRSFGEQPLMKVTLTRSGGESKVIYATPEHRWFVRDRRKAYRNQGWVEMQTRDLRPGVHQLQDVYGQGVRGITPSPFGVAHGFAYGDGRKSQGQRHSNTVTLFGEKDKALIPYFDLCSSRWNPASVGGREYSGLPNYFFEAPDIGETKSYLYGWLAGYFAADGCVSEDGMVTILSHDESAMRFLRDVCYVLGIGTYGIRHTRRVSNLDGKEYDKYAVTFMRDTLTEDFFILDEHRQRWADHPSDKRLRWRVEAVEETDLVEEVFCATVEGYGKFALADNILTGNCAFLSTEHLGPRNLTTPFIRLMEMSMLGIGVGFDTLGEGKLTVHKPEGEAATFVIPDSREGWCESVDRLLRSYFREGQTPVEFDYSLIRPAGEPIKRFGGVAAGPGPLRRLHESLVSLLDSRVGATISSADIVDIMNMIGKCVVAGNVRRSAEIAFGLPDDKEFLALKNPEVNPERMGPDGWGYLSNNSVMAEVGGNYDHLVDLIAINGEPGLNFLDLARRYGRLIDPPNDKDWRAKGANPCVTADTWVMTTEGPKRAIDLLDTPFWAVVDGKAYRSRTGMFKTRTAEVYRLTTSHGYELKLTDNHEVKTASGEMVAARDLTPGDLIQINNHRTLGMWPGRGSEGEGYLLGSFVGDGGWESGTAVVKLWEKDGGSEPIGDTILRFAQEVDKRSDWVGWRSYGRGYRVLTLPKRWIAEWVDVGSKEGDFEATSYEFHTGFLRGLFDADASVQGYDNDRGLAISLTQVSYERLQMVQRMLLRLGVISYIREARPEGVRDFGEDRGGEYHCQRSWRLMISPGSVREFMLHVGFDNETKRAKVEKAMARMTRGFYSEHFWVKVKSLEYVSTEDVYDCTVDDIHLFDANGIVVSNCAEQTLEDGELCCLVETYPIKHESLDDFKRTLKWAYLYGKAVTLLSTHWPESNEVMHRNRRIGCSVSGVAQFAERHGWTELRRWMDEGYQAVADRDRQYSEWLGVRESIKMTSVKPSGTVSLLAGVTPGVHWPEQDVYLRRMRFRNGDPIVDVCEAAGYEVEPDVMDPENSVVVTFPTRGPDVRTTREVSVWEKVSLAALMQKYWADNQVSATFTFREDERDQIGPLLRSFDGQLKSMSFLPILEGGAYAQMPYERIDIEEWEKATAKVKRMDLSSIYENGVDPEGERYCTTDVCEIPQ